MLKKREALLSSVITALLRVREVDTKVIHEDARLIADLGFSSIDIVDLLFEVTKETDIGISVPELYEYFGGSSNRAARDFTLKEIVDFLAR